MAGILLASAPFTNAADLVKLPATAMLWLSDSNARERDRSFDAANRFKLKSIQELAVMRFDTKPVSGRKILAAKLFVKPARPVQVRYLRVSTVTQRWAGRRDLRPSERARASTWRHADAFEKRPWAWPGSVFADVSMSSGNSIATWGESIQSTHGWLTVDVAPDLVYALIAGLSDGLAVADGGSIALTNNYFHGFGTEHAPYLEVELGAPFSAQPTPPRLRARPRRASEAITLEIDSDDKTLGFHVFADDQQLPQWRVPRPHRAQSRQSATLTLSSNQRVTVSVRAVSRSGALSEPAIFDAGPVTPKAAFALPDVAKAPATFVAASESHSRASVTAWAPHIKVSPLNGEPVAADDSNAQGIFDDNEVTLSAARGEYVSFQLILSRADSASPKHYRINTDGLRGPEGFAIQTPEIELYRQWYSRTRADVWQPAYAVPLRHGANVSVPDPQRGLENQRAQGVWVDVYVPKDAPAGMYYGTLTVTGTDDDAIPVRLRVYDFELPDRLGYWTELNTYQVPGRHLHQYFRVAHQNRAVFMPWVLAPQVSGAGDEVKLDFRHYDRVAGPLLSGLAFAGNRRKHQPVRTMYLPFMDSWPTPLTRQTYAYDGHWPGKGESRKHIIDHYRDAPYLGKALSAQYQAAIHTAQKQFVEHFASRGWNRTEMHVFYGGKNTHRINYGSNMWWTTDEPYHWDDWLALQFFTRHWMRGPSMRTTDARAQWRARADISRPQWLGRVLEGGANTIYFASSNFADPVRLNRLRERQGIEVRAYGGFSGVDESNTSSISHIVRLWLNGANAFLPWQTLGNSESLDVHDNVGGAAILVPGQQLGHAVLADLRLRAARDAQQLVEYLEILRRRKGVTRAQLREAIGRYLPNQEVRSGNGNPDDADAVRSHPWQMSDLLALKHAMALAIMSAPHPPRAHQ